MVLRQKGITFFGFLGFLLIGGFFAFLAMRLFPAYTEYQSVKSSMKGLAAEPGIASKDGHQIKKQLVKRLDISYVDTVKPDNITLKRVTGGYDLTVKYEVRRPLAYNLEYIATFENTVPLRRDSAEDSESK